MKKLAILFAAITLMLCIAACATVPGSYAELTPDATASGTQSTTGTTPEDTTGSTSGKTEPSTNVTNPSTPEDTIPVDPTEPSTTPSEPEKEETKPQEQKPPATKPTEPKPTDPPATEPPHTHQYTSTTTDSTCATEGKIVYKCECGDSYTKSIQKKDHQYTLTKTVESTTSKKGYKEYTCSGCGKTYKEELPLKKGAMETDVCGSSLWLKPMRHGGYYDFAVQIFDLINSQTIYKEAYDKSFPLVDEKIKLVNWFTDTYRYAAYPYSYTVYETKEGEQHWTVWGDEETFATMAKISTECKRILAEIGVTSGMKQKDAIIKINDYLVRTRYYEYDKSKVDGSPEFSIFNSAAVCHNYSMAFQMLCLHAGIECHYYSSNTMNHAWNKVYFSDGTYAWVDVCWNDSDSPNRYLLITTEQLLKDHSL